MRPLAPLITTSMVRSSGVDVDAAARADPGRRGRRRMVTSPDLLDPIQEAEKPEDPPGFRCSEALAVIS